MSVGLSVGRLLCVAAGRARGHDGLVHGRVPQLLQPGAGTLPQLLQQGVLKLEQPGGRHLQYKDRGAGGGEAQEAGKGR